MSETKFRALIVDDDPTILKLSALALADEGFDCTAVENGSLAMERFATLAFDLVVTDLAMPLKHGHSVAVELLNAPTRPVIAVLTGLIEPRLTRDLMARGVDDVIAKPVNFAMFAAKMKSLVARRTQTLQTAEDSPPGLAGQKLATVNISELTQRLMSMSCILPLSCVALDVYDLTRSGNGQISCVAAALERDPALLAEVLRVANTSRHNPTGRKIVDVERAVLLIGQRRVGEMALGNQALCAVTETVVPWANRAILSRRSIAAGVALELLSDRSSQSGDGLMTAAIMHALGRVVLGSLYPAQYGAVIDYCRATGNTLCAGEIQLFPETNTTTLARLLQYWNVPPDIFEPLSVLGHTYDQLAALPENMRAKAELLKTAVLLGELAVGQWEPWDRLDFPSRQVLDRLAIGDDLAACIVEVRNDLASIERFSRNATVKTDPVDVAQPAINSCGSVAWRNLSPRAGKMIAPILQSLGITAVEGATDLPLIVNGIGASASAIKRELSCVQAKPALLLIDSRNIGAADGEIAMLSFPCSHAHFEAACRNAAQTTATRKSPAESAQLVAALSST